jgi:hypothetical protein
MLMLLLLLPGQKTANRRVIEIVQKGTIRLVASTATVQLVTTALPA